MLNLRIPQSTKDLHFSLEQSCEAFLGELQTPFRLIDCIYEINPENYEYCTRIIKQLLKANTLFRKITISHLKHAISVRPKNSAIYKFLFNQISISDLFMELMCEKQQLHTQCDISNLLFFNDDLLTFQNQLIQTPDFLNKKLSLEINPYFDESVSLINFACAFGSIKIFKLLLMNDKNIEDKTGLYAVFGGNQEIVQILSNHDVSFNAYFEDAIQFHRNSIAQWILSNYETIYITNNPSSNFDFLTNNELFFSFYYQNSICIDNSASERVKAYLANCISAIPENNSLPNIEKIDYRWKNYYYTQFIHYYFEERCCLSGNLLRDVMHLFHQIVDFKYDESDLVQLSTMLYDNLHFSTDDKISSKIAQSFKTFYKFIFEDYIPVNQTKNPNEWSIEQELYLLFYAYQDGKIESKRMSMINKSLKAGQVKYSRLLDSYKKWQPIQQRTNPSEDMKKTINEVDKEADLIEKLVQASSCFTSLQSALNELEDNEAFMEKFKKITGRRDDIKIIKKNLRQSKYCIELSTECFKNITRDSAGQRHDSKLLKLFNTVLLTINPKAQYLMSELFGLPSRSTTFKNKKITLCDLFNGEIPVFDGTLPDLQKLFRAFYPTEAMQQELQLGGVLAIDAASIEPLVEIHENGKITGIKNIDYVPIEKAKLLRESKEERLKFYEEHENDIISHVFLIIFCPLSPKLTYLPLVKITKQNGFADEDIKNELEKIKEIIKDTLHIPVNGFGFDGDKTFLVFGRNIIERIYNLIISRSLSGYLRDYYHMELFYFYDSIHLSKNDRNKIAKGLKFAIWPTTSKYFTAQEIIDCGLSSSIFTNNSTEAQHDRNALELFSLKTMTLLISKGKKQLAFALLPSTILLMCSFLDGPSRIDRINLLTIACAYVIMYHIERKNIEANKGILQPQYAKKKNKDIVYGRFIEIWTYKFFTTCFSILSQLMDFNKDINMSALGSNLVEHCFGTNRTLSHNDKSLKGFERALENTLLYNTFIHNNELAKRHRKRSSTSEIKIAKEPNVDQTEILTFDEAICIICSFLSHLEIKTSYNFLEQFEGKDIKYKSIEHLISYLEEKTSEPKTLPSKISSKKDLPTFHTSIQMANLINKQMFQKHNENQEHLKSREEEK